jgi:hypothetical protein
MAVETRVVAAVVVAGVAGVVLRRRLLAALAGGPTAGPLSSVAEARRRRPVQVVVAGVFQLDDPCASCRQSGGFGAAPPVPGRAAAAAAPPAPSPSPAWTRRVSGPSAWSSRRGRGQRVIRLQRIYNF